MGGRGGGGDNPDRTAGKSMKVFVERVVSQYTSAGQVVCGKVGGRRRRGR